VAGVFIMQENTIFIIFVVIGILSIVIIAIYAGHIIEKNRLKKIENSRHQFIEKTKRIRRESRIDLTR
jgi:hypothetical protein